MALSAPIELGPLGADFVEVAERALTAGHPEQVADADLERIMTAAIRLYAAKAEIAEQPPVPVTAERVTPTDIVVTVTALIRAVGLNLWDVSMWFNRQKH